MFAIRQTLPQLIDTAEGRPGSPRAPLTAAVLSDQPARLALALASQSIAMIDARECDLALLLREAPDMLVIDIDPAVMPVRRIALLVAQLGWLRRDLVIAVSRRSALAVRSFKLDVIFDTEADAETLANSFCEATRLLAHSRLRPAPEAQPAAPVLRHRPARRAHLFG
ncbi:MAG: hypothetical protein C0427_12130 [Rhodobacter sp.]|nr:hypothetical protein [Rhodobacter sp.]